MPSGASEDMTQTEVANRKEYRVKSTKQSDSQARDSPSLKKFRSRNIRWQAPSSFAEKREEKRRLERDRPAVQPIRAEFRNTDGWVRCPVAALPSIEPSLLHGSLWLLFPFPNLDCLWTRKGRAPSEVRIPRSSSNHVRVSTAQAPHRFRELLSSGPTSTAMSTRAGACRVRPGGGAHVPPRRPHQSPGIQCFGPARRRHGSPDCHPFPSESKIPT